MRMKARNIKVYLGIHNMHKVTYENAENETRKKSVRLIKQERKRKRKERNGKFRITLNCRKLFGALR